MENKGILKRNYIQSMKKKKRILIKLIFNPKKLLYDLFF